MTEEVKKDDLLRELREATTEAAKNAAKEAIAEYEAEQALKREAEKQAEEDAQKLEEEIRAKVIDEMKGSGELTPSRKGAYSVNVNDKFKLGMSNEGEYKRATGLALWKYVKTGNPRAWRGLGHKMEAWGSMNDDIFDPGQFGDAAIKAAFEEGTAAEGGVLVPNFFLPEIIAKRDVVSWPRRAGVRSIPVNRDIVDIPTENAKQAVFAITAEEAAYDTDAGPSFTNLQVTVHKFTRTHRVSEELEADEAVGFPSYLSSSIGRAWGLTENQFVAIGTGSGQPQGIMIGADTDDITDIGTDAVMASSDVAEAYTSLAEPYRVNDEAVWLMSQTLEAQHIGRVSANKPELSEALLNMTRDPADGGVARLAGFRLFTDANVVAPALGAVQFVGAFGNMQYYALVERQGLVITRNPFLYEATGQIGIFCRARWGGAVMQDEAFKPIRSAA